ncbi:YbaY family lipoprotein [Thalassospira sp.]|uniref:YbaY family lipoprotein n=1 Tax=Thalassospira sp. TaxID=1912094 RepID=UPI0032EF5F72
MKPNFFTSVWVRTLCAIGMIGILSGCAGLQTDTTTVTGSVSYRERIALSPDSTFLVVRLLDVSRADAPSVEIASLRQPVGNPPMVFILPYDASKIDPRFTYAIEATIVTENDDVLFRNDQMYPVLTRDAPSDVDITVRPITTAQSDGARKTDGSDVSRDVAAIEARLPDMRVIPGQYAASDHTVTYKAYVSPDGEPLLVDEHRDLGKFGTSDVKLYYRNGQLLQFSENAKRVNYGGENDDKPLEYSLKLEFAQGRFASGTKTVNGAASTPDEHEISGALSQSKVALSRIDAMLAQLNTKPMPLAGSRIFVCDDQSRFSVSFDNDAERAIVEFPGREPLALTRISTGSGYGYGNEMYELRGKGEDAIWQSSLGKTHCAVSASPVSLALAPGDFPVVTVNDLKAEGNGIWTQSFDEMMPAITACISQNSGDLVSVLKAWPMNHGMVGVRTINGNGGRYDCLVPSDGMGTVHTELVEATTNILPGEEDVRFTPANGAYPNGECFSHKRVEQDGVFVGWLSENTC